MIDPVAAEDQMRAAAEQIARNAAAIRDALLMVGFTRDEAVMMATAWLGEMWAK